MERIMQRQLTTRAPKRGRKAWVLSLVFAWVSSFLFVGGPHAHYPNPKPGRFRSPNWPFVANRKPFIYPRSIRMDPTISMLKDRDRNPVPMNLGIVLT